MQRGAALVLVSRAAVVDFDAILDFAAKGHIRFATDVFPEEPLPAITPGAAHRQCNSVRASGRRNGSGDQSGLASWLLRTRN